MKIPIELMIYKKLILKLIIFLTVYCAKSQIKYFMNHPAFEECQKVFSSRLLEKNAIFQRLTNL
jgi:hypothetical protein